MHSVLRLLITCCFLLYGIACSADMRGFIGTWKGIIDKPFGGETQAEIALWLTAEPDKLSYEHEKNWLLGFIYLPEKKCAALVEASPTQYDRFRPTKVGHEISAKDKNIFLGKAVKLRVFNDSNKNNGHKCIGMPVGVGIDYIELESHKLINIYFKDPYSIKPKSTSFARTEVSKPLLTHISLVKGFAVGGGLDGPQEGPGGGQLAILTNSSPSQAQIKSVSIGCASLWRPYALTLAEMGIYGLTGKQENDQTLLSIGWFDETKNDYERLRWTTHRLPNDHSFDWNHLKYGPEASMKSDGHCVLDEIFKKLVVYLEKHDLALNRLEVADDLVPLDKIIGTYIVDASGVDKVTSSHGADFLDLAKRDFGTQNIFMPGDVTWRISFSKPSQRISLYASVKSSKNGEVRKDIMGKPLARNIQYDKELSERFGVDIWSLGKFLEASKNCYYWIGRYPSKSCRRDGYVNHSQNDQPFHYIIKDREVAIALFKQLAPTASFVGLQVADLEISQSCSQAPFCDLPFGTYLNAIYEGDYYRLLQMDSQYNASNLQSASKAVQEGFCDVFGLACLNSFRASMDSFAKTLGMIGEEAQHSFLYAFISDYIYYYKNNPSSCFHVSSIRVSKSGVIEGQRYEDLYGNTVSEDPDIDVVSHFHFNREFYDVWKNESGARGPLYELYNKNSQPVKGIYALQKEYGCRSKEVKVFEKNLIKLYWKFKNRPAPYWIRNSY